MANAKQEKKDVKEGKNQGEAKHMDFRDQIAKNKTKSIVLLIIVFIVFIALGYVIAIAFQLDTFALFILSTIISVFYIWITYAFSDKIALLSVGAKEADPSQYRTLYNSVENMSIASGLPMPKVYIMRGDQINAFATGKNPQHSVICVTEGAIAKLNKQELEGVIGHEMSHVANYDIRFVTIVAVVVGAISIFSQMFLRSLWFGGGRSSDNDRSGGNVIFLVLALVLAILAPIIVKLVQLAISRKREYAADAGSVEFTRYPPGLINALKKIKQENEEPMKVPDAVAPMFFSDTTKQRFAEMFQTHPSIEKRISVLEAM
ncbi:MAG: M48 family metallopeptidase [Candidatus Pacearchaeota archaeon]|nr:M48 family metallopeptidase [Candidatus Pacearchaeota archaeon]